MFKVINGWTKEKMIEHVKNNFKGKSFKDDDRYSVCVYRGMNSKKCAAGMFIQDEDYLNIMEGTNIGALMVRYTKIERSMPLTYEAMNMFQESHDSSLENETLNCMINFINNQVEN